MPLRRRLPLLPADLDTVVLTCLQKDPRKRCATARALGEDLRRILDGEPIRPAPPHRAAGPLGRAAQEPGGASAAVALSMLVFGGARRA